MNIRIQYTIIFILLVMIIFSIGYFIRGQNSAIIQNQNIAPTIITVPSILPTISISPTNIQPISPTQFEDNPGESNRRRRGRDH